MTGIIADIHFVLNLELDKPSVDHDKVKTGGCLVFILTGLADGTLFIQKLLLGVLVKAQSLDTCLQIERVDLKVFGGDEKSCHCRKLKVL